MTDRVRVIHPEGGEKMVKESLSEESDVNNIMEKWINTGVVPFGNGKEARYGDFSSGDDYHEAMVKVQEAEEHFALLPARVRAACDNDPAKFLDMVQDDEQVARLEKLGLVEEAKPPKAEEPVVDEPGGPGPVI